MIKEKREELLASVRDRMQEYDYAGMGNNSNMFFKPFRPKNKGDNGSLTISTNINSKDDSMVISCIAVSPDANKEIEISTTLESNFNVRTISDDIVDFWHGTAIDDDLN